MCCVCVCVCVWYVSQYGCVCECVHACACEDVSMQVSVCNQIVGGCV